MREFTRVTQRARWKTKASGRGRSDEFAILLEDGPYEGAHVLERVFEGRMGGCGVRTWGVRWACVRCPFSPATP